MNYTKNEKFTVPRKKNCEDLNIYEQVAQLSQRNRSAGCVSYGQKWETGTGVQYFMDIIGLYSTTVTYLASKAIKFGENRKIRAITPFKVIEVGSNRKPVYDFLLVINSN